MKRYMPIIVAVLLAASTTVFAGDHPAKGKYKKNIPTPGATVAAPSTGGHPPVPAPAHPSTTAKKPDVKKTPTTTPTPVKKNKS